MQIGDKIRKIGDDDVYRVTGVHVDGTVYASRDTDRYVQEVTIAVNRLEFWKLAKERKMAEVSAWPKCHAEVLANGE